MKLFSERKKYATVLVFFLASLFIFSKTSLATGDGLPLGGTVSVLGPAWQITLDKEECQIDQWTVAEETQTTSWQQNTDQGSDQTFNLEPDYSPEPHPEAYIVDQSVISKTPDSIGQGKWLLGLYQTTYKNVGTCQYTDTTTYPPVSISWDWPYYMELGNVTMYGVSGSSV